LRTLALAAALRVVGATNSQPRSGAAILKKSFSQAALVLPVAAAFLRPTVSRGVTDTPLTTLASLGNAYTTLGVGRDGQPMPMCRVLNGMWQVSGAHGYTPVAAKVVEQMGLCAKAGFNTFDLADHYGDAEEYVGRFSKQTGAGAEGSQFFTKWVPRPQPVSRQVAQEAVARSLRYMQTDRLDLLQFHWWDYADSNYIGAIEQLASLKQVGNLGLTNFDTKHMVGLLDRGAPIVSNQVSFSVLDTRPLQRMTAACLDKNVKLLCYGTLLGGFLSSRWLGKGDPSLDPDTRLLSNVSLRKYLKWIQVWGGWSLFQELLVVLDTIAQKHQVSLSNVAQRWVLDQPAVGGVIVGVRLGLREHVADNAKVFSFSLDEADRQAIQAVQSKRRNDLMKVYGDCGGEYRRA